MKRYPYSDVEVYRIFRALHERRLALFLGFIDKEPMIWLTDRTPLTREPVTIATAAMILDEVLTRELEGRTEVLVGEILDALIIPICQQRAPRRQPLLLGSLV